MDVVIHKAKNLDDALKMVKDLFFDDHAKRVHDYVYLELFFDLIKLNRGSRNEEVTHENFLNELFSQILEISDIRAMSENSSNVMDKTVVAVGDVEAFKLVYKKGPRELQELNLALKACALETHRAAL